VPDQRHHRGPHPADCDLFAPARLTAIHDAGGDLAWLLSRGYALESSKKLVGDRYALQARQRLAMERSVCSDQQRTARLARQATSADLAGAALWIDGYNVLTTIEAALAGGVLLECRDGCLRDMASMHGSYRKVAETLPALDYLGQVLDDLGPSECRWLLDKPVSNSGRLKTLIEATAARRQSPWTVDLVPDPDRPLAASSAIVATADSVILDRCQRWFNLAQLVVELHVPNAWRVRLG